MRTTDHAAVRAGDDRETINLLLRLARQAVRRSGPPPPSGHSAWTNDACRELISDVFVRKGLFVEKAIVNTVTCRDLELYLLTTFENVLRDQARETERGKLIERLKTILGKEPQFLRHTSPYNAWRLDTAPDLAWQGDIGHLIRAALTLRGIAVTEWNTSGKTPKATRDAIVDVCSAALDKAAGFVRDPDVAHVVQTCIPAVPLERQDTERAVPAEELAEFEVCGIERAVLREPDGLTAEDVAAAVWAALTHDERRAVPHLVSERGVGTALGLPRRTAAAVTDSTRAKIRTGTTEGLEVAVLNELIERSEALTAELEGETP